MELGELFDEVSVSMKSELEMIKLAIDKHAGVRGDILERIFRSFLSKHLPKSMDVSSGFIVDAAGRQSKQLDIIISDSTKTPVFYAFESMRVIPVECVYAVIEIKSNLLQKELGDIHKNMMSVKSLNKTAFHYIQGVHPSFNLYGKKFEIHPVMYFVFSYDCDDISAIFRKLKRLQNGTEQLDKRIDSICVLNKGVICNKDGQGDYSALPELGTQLDVIGTKKALLLFYALMSFNLNQAQLPIFKITPYIKKINWR